MRLSDWSSDVCSPDLTRIVAREHLMLRITDRETTDGSVEYGGNPFGAHVDRIGLGDGDRQSDHAADRAVLRRARGSARIENARAALIVADAEHDIELLTQSLHAGLQRATKLRNVGRLDQIGRASCRERVCRTCRSRWSAYH